jgi:porphobilinogen synthase
VRDLLRRELLTPADLAAPMLVQPDHRPSEDYQHLPGAVAFSAVAEHARELRALGVRAVKLFAYVERKTTEAAEALRGQPAGRCGAGDPSRLGGCTRARTRCWSSRR